MRDTLSDLTMPLGYRLISGFNLNREDEVDVDERDNWVSLYNKIYDEKLKEINQRSQ